MQISELQYWIIEPEIHQMANKIQIVDLQAQSGIEYCPIEKHFKTMWKNSVREWF